MPLPEGTHFASKEFAGGANHHAEDSWNIDVGTIEVRTEPWAGGTIVYESGSYPQVYDHEVTDEGRPPRQAPSHKQTTTEERESYNWARLSYVSLVVQDQLMSAGGRVLPQAAV